MITIALILFGWLVLLLANALFVGDMVDAAHAGNHEWTTLNEAIATRAEVNPLWEKASHVQWVARTLLTRAGVLWMFACFIGLAVYLRRPLRNRLQHYFREPDSAFNLAIFRIVVFGKLVLNNSSHDEFVQHVGLPDVLLHPPSGLGPILSHLLPTAETAPVIGIAWYVATVAATLGLFTRFSTIASLLISLYVLGIPQLYGKVNHMHHLIWFAALAASTRCGDVLSVDAWIRRRREAPAPSRAYGLPLRFAWILLGLVYFFPGVWKLWTGGVDWIFSDHLRNQIWHQWSTFSNWTPIIDPTGSSLLTKMGGLSVIVFEMGFVFMMFSPRTRLIAVLAGLVFHLMNLLTLNIGFFSLMAVYVVLFDWSGILARLGVRSNALGIGVTGGRPGGGTILPPAIMGVILIVPTTWFGITGNNYGWPFACYPKFAYPMFVPERQVIDVELRLPDGTRESSTFLTERSRLRGPRWHGMTKKALNTRDDTLRAERLEALRQLAAGDPPPGAEIIFLKSIYSTKPEDRGNPPLRREEISRISIPGP